MSLVPPDPGATAESITPPFPIRLLDQLEEISAELSRLGKPELAEVKANVDRAIAQLKMLAGTDSTA